MAVIAFPSEQLQQVLVDSTERTQALDIFASWIVEAPAGSGKTGLLMQRFLKLLATVREPAEVLALTFTQRATAEMRDRILTALRAVQDGSFLLKNDFDRLTFSLAQAVLQRDQAERWRLLERPYQLNIRTIDSLCSEIAKSVPLLAGGLGFSRPVRDANPLYRRAAHAVLMRFGGEDKALNDAVYSVLLHRDGNLATCESTLAAMLGTREQWYRLIPLESETLTDEALDRDVLPRLSGALERTLCAALKRLHQCFPEELLARVASIAQQLASAENYKNGSNPFVPCAMLPDAPGTEPQHRDHWIIIANLLLTADGKWRARFDRNHIKAEANRDSKAALERIKEALADEDELADLLHAVRDLPQAAYPPEQWRLAKALFRLLRYSLEELQTLFASTEACDFPAVSLAAQSVLQQSAGDRSLAVWPRHLLVDEMQDTSSTQYELLETLTAAWDGRTHTVFLVGDPKQSIYLFRQARVELFQKAMEQGRLGKLPLGPLRLRTNFRSGRHLVNEFNEMFTEIFPNENAADGDVTYTTASAVLPAKDGEELRWNVRKLPYIENDLAARRQERARSLRNEAQSIAAHITAFRLRYGLSSKIAVLTRSRSHITEVTKALAAEGIPFRAVEMESLGERQEVLDILAITRALLHPADRTAWLAILRAPWCGAGAADLFMVGGGDIHGERKQALRQHLRTRAASLEEAGRDRILRTLDVMDAALRHTGTERLSTRVERTWRSLGGDVCTNQTGRENIRLFLRVLDSMEADDESVTADSLGRRLESLYAEPSHSDNAVDVMTIHKAKGLEWDMVLVPGTHREIARRSWALLDWIELPTSAPDGGRDVLLAPLPSSAGEKNLLNEYIKNTRKQRASAEVKRLLYVAATRAKTSLQFFAWPDLTKDGDVARVNDTLFGVAQPTLPESFQTERTFTSEEEFETLALAASIDCSAEKGRKPQVIQRLASYYDPLEELHRAALAPLKTKDLKPQRFSCPEGSFGARAVGNVVHAFIERLLREFATRHPASNTERVVQQLKQEIPTWRSAALATLSAGGLPPAEAERAQHTVMRALSTLLESSNGRWLLLPHKGAATEASWRSLSNGATRQIRIDRSFFAGSQPYAPGQDTLWIVDFKTGDPERNLDAFLQEERLRYEPQLQTYAEVLLRSQPQETPVVLALFFPLMDRLVYWPYCEDPQQPEQTTSALTPTGSKDVQLSLFG